MCRVTCMDGEQCSTKTFIYSGLQVSYNSHSHGKIYNQDLKIRISMQKNNLTAPTTKQFLDWPLEGAIKGRLDFNCCDPVQAFLELSPTFNYRTPRHQLVSTPTPTPHQLLSLFCLSWPGCPCERGLDLNG